MRLIFQHRIHKLSNLLYKQHSTFNETNLEHIDSLEVLFELSCAERRFLKMNVIF